MSPTDETVVRREVTVDVPLERAFAAFTERFGDFKPKEHNLLASPIAETTFEARVGGHIFDRRRGRQRVPLGPRPCLRTTEPCRVQLGHQPLLADRGR